jgi:predicted dehydrogenase
MVGRRKGGVVASRGNGLRIGIVGKRGAAFVAGFRSVPDTSVAALCEANPETLQTIADRHEIPERYHDFDAMLEANLDAVVVATPMHLHVPQSVAALQKGKDVLSEVTAAVSLEECPRLVQAVRESGRTYMMAENYCYTKANVLIEHLAREGLFGDVYYAEGAYIHDCRAIHYDAQGNPTWRTVWQVGKNGCTYGAHSLGPVLQWLDEKVVTVACLGSGVHTEPRHRMDDTVTMLGKTERGGLVNIRVDMQSHRPHNMTHYALQGTKGAYQSARRMGEPNLIWIEGRSPARETWEDLSTYETEFLPEPWRSWERQATGAGHGGGDFFVAREFISSILDGTIPPIDVYRALDFTVPGLISEQSIAQGGVSMPVPEFRVAGDL